MFTDNINDLSDSEDDIDDDEEDEPDHQLDYDYLLINRNQSESHNRCCNRRLWCIKDICGFICCFFTWFLISYAQYVVMFLILLPRPITVSTIFNMAFFQIVSVLAVVSHLKTMFTDPVSNTFDSF